MSGKKILVMFGPPAAGKGTQAIILQDKYNIPQLSTGDMLRAAAKEDSDSGRKLAEVMASGQLVSDDLIIDAIKSRVAQPDCAGGCIFDGFPRTTAQAEALDKMLAASGDKILAILNINVDDDELKSRVATRYEEAIAKGEAPREDDNIETYKKRLEIYREKTLPVLDYYKNNHAAVTFDIDGRKSIDDVTGDIENIVN